MDLLVTIGAVLVAALLFYLSIPVLLFLLVDALFRFRGSRDADRVFRRLIVPLEMGRSPLGQLAQKMETLEAEEKGHENSHHLHRRGLLGQPGPRGLGGHPDVRPP